MTPRAAPPRGRLAEPGEPAQRLPVPLSLPARDACVC
jgi:hypothetical protein